MKKPKFNVRKALGRTYCIQAILSPILFISVLLMMLYINWVMLDLVM